MGFFFFFFKELKMSQPVSGKFRFLRKNQLEMIKNSNSHVERPQSLRT